MPNAAQKDFDRLLRDVVVEQIEAAVKDRFGSSVTGVDTKIVENQFGDMELVVTIEINVDTPRAQLREGFFGLTSHVRKAMGKELKDVFPVIVPVSSSAHA